MSEVYRDTNVGISGLLHRGPVVTLKFGLGLCYEFTIVSGRKMKLKFLGGNPLQWQDDDYNLYTGEPDTGLGEFFTNVTETPCWNC